MRGLKPRLFVVLTLLAAFALVTVPSATGDHNGVTAERDPAQPNGKNQWYTSPVEFTFSGPSGYECNPAQTTYGNGVDEGDDESATVSTSCSDPLGILPELSHDFTVKYDATPPDTSVSRDRPAPDSGWYRNSVTFTADATGYGPSGAGSCQGPTVYDGPDSGSAEVTLSCEDGAGNSDADTANFKYDGTPPDVSVDPGRPPDQNGWYNHSVTFTPDPSNVGPSGLGGCGDPLTYNGPDTTDGSVTRSCTDGAGNSASDTATFKYDGAAPTVVVSAAREPDFNNWYNHPVTFTAQGSDFGISGPGSCENESYDGPNGEAASVTLACEDGAGNRASDSKAFKYDDTAPDTEITGQPADPSKNVSPAFSFDANESDRTFECRLDGQEWAPCSSGDSVAGLDDGSHTFEVRAIDRADNDDPSPASHTWRVDTRPPPRVSNLEARVTDVIDSLTVRLLWDNPSSADVDRVVVKRGRRSVCCDAIETRFTDDNINTNTYRYSVSTRDAAGNASETRRVRVKPILLTPEDGASRSRTPRLFDWRSVPDADFYHFQLWRLKSSGVRKGTHPLIVRWPDESEMTLRRGLADGRYGWWVWRGTGNPATGTIHVPPVGSSYFTKR